MKSQYLRKAAVVIVFILWLATMAVTVKRVYYNDVNAFGIVAKGAIRNNEWYHNKSIAFVSRHKGTVQDFKYVEKELALTNVTYYLHYGIDFDSSGTNKTQAEEICRNHDAVVVSDCLSDGWEFIKDGERACKNVIFIVSNRFDVCIYRDDREYFNKDFEYALNRDDEYELTIVPNNEFELFYIKYRNITLKKDYPIIRPFGYSDMEPQEIDEKSSDPNCMVINRFDSNTEFLKKEMEKNIGFSCKTIPRYYGGALTLSKYDSVIVHLPYQASVMKMWENIAAGVLMAIPSPEFFLELNKNKDYRTPRLTEVVNLVGKDHWPHLVDFYLPQYEKCFIQFNSWEHLGQILTTKSYKQNINLCMDLMVAQRKESLNLWENIFKKMY